MEVGVIVGVAVSGISVDVAVGVAEDVGVGVYVGVFVGVDVKVEVGRMGMLVRVDSGSCSCSCFSSVEGQGIAPPAASKHPPSCAWTKFRGENKNIAARNALAITNKINFGFMVCLIGINLPAKLFQF